VLSVLALVLLSRGFTLGMSFRKLRASLRYGIAYLPHNLSGWIMGLLDRLLLGGMSGYGTVGIYNVGYTLGGAMGMIAVAFNLAYTPYYMKKVQQHGGHEAARTLARVATSWFIVMVFLALGISMFAREMVYVMAAGSYYEAWRVIPIIVLAFLCQGVYFLVVKPIIQSKRYIRYLPIGSFSGGVVNLLGNALLIPRFGMMGAAWATLASYSAMMGIAYTLSRRALRIPYEYSKAARSLAIGLGLFFATDLLHATSLPWWSCVVVKAVSLASYPLFLVLSGVLQSRDLHTAWRVIRRTLSKKARTRENVTESNEDSRNLGR